MFNYIAYFRMVWNSWSFFLPTEIRDFVFRIPEHGARLQENRPLKKLTQLAGSLLIIKNLDEEWSEAHLPLAICKQPIIQLKPNNA